MADVLANSMAGYPRAACHIAGCCHQANSMTCHPRATFHVAGWAYCHLVNSSVMIPEPHATLQSAVIWRNQCHDRATLQGVRIASAILKIAFRHIFYFFCFLNAAWAWTSGGFRIVSDTLVKIGPVVFQWLVVENRSFPLLWQLAYTTACTTVQAETEIKFTLVY